MRITVLFFLVVFFAFGCRQQNQTYQKRYIDFDSLIVRQIDVLRLAQPQILIDKKAMMGNEETSGKIKGDSIAIARELDIFRQMDIINKPLFRDQYTITIESDAKSNLSVKVFRTKIKSPIPYIKLYYLDDLTQLKRIEARFEEENTLYYTRRDYTLEFVTRSNMLVVAQSHVKGVQKMILNDSVSFFVMADFQSPH